MGEGLQRAIAAARDTQKVSRELLTVCHRPDHAAFDDLLAAARATVRYLGEHDQDGDWREVVLQDLKSAISLAQEGTQC